MASGSICPSKMICSSSCSHSASFWIRLIFRTSIEATKRHKAEKAVLGVLGGMGGLASAEFVKTVYEVSGGVSHREQEAPVVLMYSDPGFPDRTEAFLGGETQLLLTRLIEAL